MVLPATAAATVVYDPGELIRLKDSYDNLIDYDDTRSTEAMRRQLREVNKVLREADVDLPGQAAIREGPFLRIGDSILNLAMDVMHRVFSRGTFAFHGRLYGSWWQSIPKELRRHLIVNGEPTTELDYGAQHLRMLYAAEGAPLGSDDPYIIAAWPRNLVKRAVLALINARDEAKSIGVICDNRRGSSALTGPGAHARARKLFEDIKRRHAPVAHRFHRDEGIRLMRKDSELVVSILNAMYRRGIVVLPIHDSFVSGARFAGQLREEMEAVWHRQIGEENPSISLSCSESFPHNPPDLFVVLPVGRQLDLFGGRSVPDSFLSWSGGIASPASRRFLRDELRERQIRGSDLARELRISRPQLVNVLKGRYGTTPRVANALKSWALERR